MTNPLAQPRAPYLLNIWYVAAWSHELGDSLLGRTLLERPVALFRDGHGQPRAIGGRCPHRFAPLADGRICEDGAVECPYHGLRFGADGRCTFNPHPPGNTARIAVPTWPIVEKHGFLWIWFGDAARADPALIPDFSFLDQPDRWEIVRGKTDAEGNYELYTDNILDLGHVNFLHPALKAPAYVAGERRSRQDGDTVWYHVFHPDDHLSLALGPALGALNGERKDSWTDVRWSAPSAMYLIITAADPGQSRDTGVSTPSMHFLTPESPTRTHYFWAVARETHRGDAAFTEAMRQGFHHAFEKEDQPMIARQQEMMMGKTFWELDPVLLKGDASAVMARRILDRRIREEMGEA